MPLEQIEERLKIENGPIRSLREELAKQLLPVIPTAPPEMKAKLQQSISFKEPQIALPSTEAIAKSRQMVRQNPENREFLENLLSVERQAKNMTYVGYLEGRINSLDGKAEK